MALVQSRQHKAYKAEWRHSCQPGCLPVSHDTLVQEGNYLSHTTHLARRHTQNICTHNQSSHVCRAGHQQIGSCANSTFGIRGAKTFIKKTQQVEYTTFKVKLGKVPDHCCHSLTPHTRVLLHATLISLGIGCWRFCPAGLRTLSALLPTWLWKFFLARH